MSRPPKDVQQLARSHTQGAIKTLVGIMNEPRSETSARVQAARVILDRGWGQAKQSVDMKHGVDDPLAALLGKIAENGKRIGQD